MAVEGLMPASNNDVNVSVGSMLRNFVSLQDQVHRMHNVLVGINLTAAPFSFTAQQAADITTSVANLDTSLQAVDMTFINRLVGLF